MPAAAGWRRRSPWPVLPARATTHQLQASPALALHSAHSRSSLQLPRQAAFASRARRRPRPTQHLQRPCEPSSPPGGARTSCRAGFGRLQACSLALCPWVGLAAQPWRPRTCLRQGQAGCLHPAPGAFAKHRPPPAPPSAAANPPAAAAGMDVAAAVRGATLFAATLESLGPQRMTAPAPGLVLGFQAFGSSHVMDAEGPLPAQLNRRGARGLRYARQAHALLPQQPARSTRAALLPHGAVRWRAWRALLLAPLQRPTLQQTMLWRPPLQHRAWCTWR